jgi:hypothetical protein
LIETLSDLLASLKERTAAIFRYSGRKTASVAPIGSTAESATGGGDGKKDSSREIRKPRSRRLASISQKVRDRPTSRRRVTEFQQPIRSPGNEGLKHKSRLFPTLSINEFTRHAALREGCIMRRSRRPNPGCSSRNPVDVSHMSMMAGSRLERAPCSADPELFKGYSFWSTSLLSARWSS